MTKKFSRVLWIISGVLLILSGIICIANPAVAVAALAIYLGIVMLVSGIIDITIFIKGHKKMHGSGWFLVEGILTIMLSLLVLFNEAFTVMSMPFIFGMWLLFSGTSKIANSFDLKAAGIPNWGWFLASGIIFVLVGFGSFLNPVAGALTLGAITGFILILQGAGTIMRSAFSGKFLK